MALVADSNFTNNLVSVSAFSPFPTGGGNKVLQLNVTGGGVILEDTVSTLTLNRADLLVDALVQSTPSGTNGSFGFIVNRNGSGKFYYLSMQPEGFGTASFRIHRYSGGVGGSFTLLANTSSISSVYTPGTIFEFRGRYKNSNTGPNLSIVVDGLVYLAVIDSDATNQSNSGQVGLASNILSGNGNAFDRYTDNWFVREVD
jgi:hypothetical protein